MNRNFNKLTILTDCDLHCVNVDYDAVNTCKGNLILNAETHLKAFVWMWNFLRLSFAGSKIHLAKDHTSQQMRKWKGIGSFNKEFMEADHVTGNKEARRFSSLRSENRKARAVS